MCSSDYKTQHKIKWYIILNCNTNNYVHAGLDFGLNMTEQYSRKIDKYPIDLHNPSELFKKVQKLFLDSRTTQQS